MALVQAWPAPSAAETSGSASRSGTATTAGNDLFASVVVRSADVDTVAITDDGGNTWTEVAHVTDTLMYIGLFRAAGAASISTLTASMTDASDQPVVAAATVLLEEHSSVGSEIDTATITVTPDGGQPAATTATGADQLLIAAAGTQVTGRSWSVTGTGVTPVAGESFQGQQTTHLRASAYTTAGGDVAIGWDRTGGSDSSLYIINALYEEGSGGPTPLSVDAGADQSVYVGQTATVAATASGGTAPYTYAWTKVSGPAGSFLNANQASTTFTPSGGAGTYVLRCIATDSTSTTAQDDLTLTVSQAPALVTVASVNASTGWTPTGGTVLQVLSDTSDSTLVTSQENPTEQVLDVTMGPAVVAEGQHWTQRVRMRRSSSSTSGTATGYLYVGSTLISTVTGKPIPGTLGDVDFTFPNADVSAITGAQWTDGVRFVVEVTAA